VHELDRLVLWFFRHGVLFQSLPLPPLMGAGPAAGNCVSMMPPGKTSCKPTGLAVTLLALIKSQKNQGLSGAAGGGTPARGASREIGSRGFS